MTKETPASPTTNPSDGFVDKVELATLLKVTVRTVENWQRRRLIPFVRVGRVVLFHWPDVVEHLRKNFRVCGS